MRNQLYSHKARHIVKFSSLFITALLDCAVSMADESSDKTKVVIPPADSTTFVYNGSLQTYSLSSDTTLYSIFGDAHTTAGKYEVTVSLNNPLLYEWEDGSTDPKTYDFTINKSQVEIPLADTSKFVYNGQEQTFRIAENEN